VHQPVWFNRVDDPTRPFLAFLNVRYVFAGPDRAPPEGWNVLYRGEEGTMFENPYALPRAFVPRFLRFEPDPQQEIAVLAGIRDFAEEGVLGETPPAGTANALRANGRASVRIVSYLPQRMTLEVEAAEPAVVAISVTAWPGWKLEIDGGKARFLSYNHAFLGFRVSPGRHRAELRYLPDSFLAGSVISLVTLVIGVFLLRRGCRTARSPR
jgi:hypothetical protein